MKVFISQVTHGRSNTDIEKERCKAIDKLKELFPEDIIEILNSNTHDTKDCNLWALSEAISLMSDADCVFFCKGWYKDKECSVEHMVCAKYCINVAYHNQ